MRGVGNRVHNRVEPDAKPLDWLLGPERLLILPVMDAIGEHGGLAQFFWAVEVPFAKVVRPALSTDWSNYITEFRFKLRAYDP